MRTNRLKPKHGFAYYLHLGLTTLLPLLVFVFVRIDFLQLAIVVVLLSKWRIFAVRPRYWGTNIRSNAVDIMVGLAAVVFMAYTFSPGWQFFWAALYAGWLLFIKPRSGVIMVSIQALLGQTLGLMALFLWWKQAPLIGLVFAVWAICYLSARHFFTSFDENYGSMYAHVWAYFGGALAWVLGHWLLFYGELAQPTLLLTVIGSGLATMYYLDQTDRSSVILRRQFVFIMVAVVVVVLAFSDWGDKAI
jgi:hypothetical protein